MKKKLTKHGNSLALVIDKPLLKLLNISDKTNLELSIKDGVLIVRPVSKQKKYKNEDMTKIAEDIMDEYADVFQKLAK